LDAVVPGLDAVVAFLERSPLPHRTGGGGGGGSFY
jgi:hypothetical protein